MGDIEELRNTVAVVFRRCRKDQITEEEFKNTVSFALNWFGHAKAGRLLGAAVRTGVAGREGDGSIRARFDVTAVQVPLGFRPAERLLDAAPGEGVLLRVVTEVAVRRNLERAGVMARVSSIQASLGIDSRVAALLVAAEEGVTMAEEIAGVEREILAERMRTRTPPAPDGAKG